MHGAYESETRTIRAMTDAWAIPLAVLRQVGGHFQGSTSNNSFLRNTVLTKL
jgi:hypothetical protein